MKEKYLKKLFQAYYRSHAKDFPEISSFQLREFAFLSWDRKGMVRHLQFPSNKFLIQHLISTAPRHSYHSATYYQRPGAETMDQKGYLGCDFVVDIDADHIPTPCRENHDYAVCKSCGKVFHGEKPLKCPECEGTKFDKIAWICDECLNVSKKQVFNLIENFLLDDFSIPMEDIQLFFSGHRGYHIHLKTKSFLNLDQDARREISDYVTGQGFSFKLWNYKKIQNNMMGFTIEDPGWSGKIARELYNILIQGEIRIREIFENPIYGKKLNSTVLGIFISNRQYLISQLLKKRRIWQISGISDKSWERIFEILRDRIKADIDVVVSIDLHRLIRLEGSLHGKTGFKVMKLNYENLKEFDPLKDALSFPNNLENTLNLEITAPLAPKIRIGDEFYGPYNQGEKVKIPLNAALFLMCKDVAQLTQKSKNNKNL
ncbi:MAG: DNA primase small subunit domain-containing protein [Promethearchaeota archaeon]